MTKLKFRHFFYFLLISCATPSTPVLTTPNYETGLSTNKNREYQHESEKIYLSWPLKGTANLTRGFMIGIRPHQGLDLSAPRGTPVKAAHAGYVEYAGKDFSGYGNLVIINSGASWSTFYAHLHKIRVREGQNLKRGDTVGTVGATGNARGVHLHFELRYKERPLDPLDYLPPVD